MESTGGASDVPHLGWCCLLQPRVHASLTHHADMHVALCHSLVHSGSPPPTYYAAQLSLSLRRCLPPLAALSNPPLACAGACPHLLRCTSPSTPTSCSLVQFATQLQPQPLQLQPHNPTTITTTTSAWQFFNGYLSTARGEASVVHQGTSETTASG